MTDNIEVPEKELSGDKSADSQRDEESWVAMAHDMGLDYDEDD